MNCNRSPLLTECVSIPVAHVNLWLPFFVHKTNSSDIGNCHEEQWTALHSSDSELSGTLRLRSEGLVNFSFHIVRPHVNFEQNEFPSLYDSYTSGLSSPRGTVLLHSVGQRSGFHGTRSFKPATGSYPDPVEYSPQPHTLLLQDPFHPLTHTRVSQMLSSLQVFRLKF
jgi:hypothetical protein